MKQTIVLLTIAMCGIGYSQNTTQAGDSSGKIGQMQQMMEVQQSFNLQYLLLQQQMQNENRRYSCISNIMKTKHDTAKNSISNIR